MQGLLCSPTSKVFSAHRYWLCIGLLAYAIAAQFLVERWQAREDISLRNLTFGYGALIEAIETTGEYKVQDVHYQGVAFSAHRLPLIPGFLIAARSLVGDDLRAVGRIKTAVFGSALLLALGLVLLRSNAPLWLSSILLSLVLFSPRWILQCFELSIEEGYNIPLLGLLFALLWFHSERPPTLARGLGIGTCLALLLVIKSSMLFLAIAIAPIAYIAWKKLKTSLAIAVCVTASLLGLACFNAQVSGRFTVSSSWEGWNLYKGNNALTLQYYPTYHLDNLDDIGAVKADRPLLDEWDYDAYFKGKALTFIRENPMTFLKACVVKFQVFFLEFRETGMPLGAKPRTGAPFVIQAAFLLLFRIALWAAIAIAAIRLWTAARSRSLCWVSASFLLFLALYSGFHIVGFAYERHVMPILLPTAFYLLRCVQSGPLARSIIPHCHRD